MVINTQGLSCPQPVLIVLQCIKDNSPDYLSVIVDNEASHENVSRAAMHHGYSVESIHETNYIKIELRRS